MPASSPYQNNDYQAANSFRPSRLPVNDIMKAYIAQNQFWDQGAQKVKNVYDNALNLSLTLDENKKVRDDYMKEAEKQMTKLSSMDLSDPSVQRQGLNVFKPLLSDKSIIMDNHLTNLRSSIITDAESYKDKKLSKDGPEGEGYSDINLSDALDGFEDFNSKTPRDEKLLSTVYNRVRDKRYIPFYNINKTFDEALKNCKGAVNQDTDADGLNNRITKTTGISAAQAKLCIESSLANDNKALEQIGINGRQQFKNNRSALVQSVQPYLQSDIDNNDAMIRRYQAEKLALVNSKTATPEQLAQYDEVINKYTDEKKKAQAEYNRVSANDWNDIDQNYKSWSQRIYKHSLISSYATPRATQGTEVSIEGDPSRLAQYKENAEDARLQFRLKTEHENRMEEKMFELAHSKEGNLSLAEKLKYGQMPGGKPFDPRNIEFLSKAEVGEAETIGTLKQKLEENYKASYGDLQDIAAKMSSIDNADFVDILKNPPKNQMDYAKVIDVANRYLETRGTQLGGIDKLKGSDAALLESVNKYREKVSYSNALNNILDNATSNAKTKNPELYKDYNIALNNITSVPSYKVLYHGGSENPKYVDISSDFVKQALTNPTLYKVSYKGGSLSITNNNTQEQYDFYNSGGDAQSFKKGFRGELIHDALDKGLKAENNYITKVNEELRGNQALNKLIYKGDKYLDDLITDDMQRLFPETTSEYTFTSMSQDVRTGDVKIKVIKKGTKGEKPIPLEDATALQDAFGKSIASEGSLFKSFDKETGVATINIPSVKIVERSYLDDAVDLLKEDLAIRARQQRKPVTEMVHQTRKLTKVFLQATPLSTGTTYTIKTQGPGQTKPQTVQEFSDMPETQVNAAIEHFRTLDKQPEIPNQTK